MRNKTAPPRAAPAAAGARAPTAPGHPIAGRPGDLIKKITAKVGIKPCKGCERRAEALNRWAKGLRNSPPT